MKASFQHAALRTLRLTSAGIARNRDCADIPHVKKPQRGALWQPGVKDAVGGRNPRFDDPKKLSPNGAR